MNVTSAIRNGVSGIMAANQSRELCFVNGNNISQVERVQPEDKISIINPFNFMGLHFGKITGSIAQTQDGKYKFTGQKGILNITFSFH